MKKCTLGQWIKLTLKIFFITFGMLSIIYSVFNYFDFHVSTVGCDSNSMLGVLRCNCIIIYDGSVGNVKEGDILLYESYRKNIIHRFIGYCNRTIERYDYDTEDYKNVTIYDAYKTKGGSVFNEEECIPPYDVYGRLLFKFC